MKIAKELPSTRNAICGYWEEGMGQSCGTAMSWRIVLTPKKEGQLRVRRIEYICSSCGAHYLDDCGHQEHDENFKELIFEQYLVGFVAFVHHDPKKVGYP
jgi:hypothetical protein